MCPVVPAFVVDILATAKALIKVKSTDHLNQAGGITSVLCSSLSSTQMVFGREKLKKKKLKKIEDFKKYFETKKN